MNDHTHTHATKPRIGIIGGFGRVGSAMAVILKDKGYAVQISDIDTDVSNHDLAKSSDIILVSVPVNVIPQVAQEIGPVLSKDSIVIHVCSIAEGPSAELRKHTSSGAAIYFAHPTFDPDNWADPSQTVVMEKEAHADQRLTELWHDLFEVHKIVIATPEEHDEMASLVQAVSQLMTLGIAVAFANMHLQPDRCFNYQHHPKFAIQMAFVGRMLHQKPELYSNILFGSEVARTNSKRFAEHIDALRSETSQKFFDEWATAKEFFTVEHHEAEKRIAAVLDNVALPMFVTSRGDNREMSELPSTIQVILALALAKLLMERKVSLQKLRAFSSPIYNVIMGLTVSTLHERGMLAISTYSVTFFDELLKTFHDILGGGHEAHHRHFLLAREHFGTESCARAFEVTSQILHFHGSEF